MQSAAPERPTSRHQRHAVLAAILGAGLLLALGGLAPAALAATPTPPFLQCPAVDEDSSCQYLIYVTGTSTQSVTVLQDASQPFYDGSDDTLVGIVNDSATPLSSINIGVDGSGDDSFGFDGDGMCDPDNPPIPQGCPFAGTGGGDDPYDYEGPDTSYTAGTTDDSGVVTFTTPLAANGGTTYFSLEASPSIGTVAGTGPISFLLASTLTDDNNGSVTDGPLDEPAPTNVTDTATLYPSGDTAGGHVVYSVYSDPACATMVATSSAAVTTGTPAASTPAGASLPTNATYYWMVQYFDANGDLQATQPCGQETMVFGTPPSRPASTIQGSVSGAGMSGTTIGVANNTPVTASASITAGAGSAAAPTGYAYYTWYGNGDTQCDSTTDQVGSGGRAVVTNGAGGSSSAVTPPFGTDYLQIVYSGDSNNGPATSCAKVTVVEGAVSMGVTASGDGSSGTSINVPVGTSITAAAAVSALGADPAPTGGVSFAWYSDSACTNLLAQAGEGTITNGSAGASQAVMLPAATSYVQATYSGDSGNAATTKCSPVTVSEYRPAPAITASATGGGTSGATLNVAGSTAVTATATIAGGAGSTASPSGTVTYAWFSDTACTKGVASAGSATVSAGSGAPSSSVVLPTGTSYLQVSYSGDTYNAPATLCTPVKVTEAPPPPVLYKDVDVFPISGQVYVKLPNGASAAIAQAELEPLAVVAINKGQGFIPLSEAREIPVGSILDTRAGTVKVTAASTKAKQQYTANITAGIFELEQNRKQKGLTQLTLMDTANGRKVCASKGKKTPHYGPLRASAAKGKSVGGKVLGLLKSTDTGKFQTKGDFASATVRGTQYSVTDECAGTLTSVSRGTVTVDYFARRKNVVVKAGYYYLAKASGAKSKVQKIGK